MSKTTKSWEQTELELLERGLAGADLEIQQYVTKCILELIDIFWKQEHSGFSANYCKNLFARLIDHKPLSPLTGNDSEWMEISSNEEQNLRYPALFRKNKDNSLAEDINSVVFSDDGGLTWFSSGCLRKKYQQPIQFPYYPTNSKEVFIKWIDEEHNEFVDISNDEEEKEKLRQNASKIS